MVSIPVFPSLPVGFPVKWSPALQTITDTAKSGREVRFPNRGASLYKFELLFNVLRDRTQNQTPYVPLNAYTDYMQLCQFWLQMYGKAGRFYFDAPWDDSRTDQLIATGDGSSTKFLMVRTFGLTGASITEVVGGVKAITNVKLNGVIQGSSEYSFSGNILTFTSAPSAGATIQATFSYYYLCRFEEDEQDFEEFLKNFWRVPSLKFDSILPTPDVLDLVGLQLQAAGPYINSTGVYLNNYNPSDSSASAPSPIPGYPSPLVLGSNKWPPAPPAPLETLTDNDVANDSAASTFATGLYVPFFFIDYQTFPGDTPHMTLGWNYIATGAGWISANSSMTLTANAGNSAPVTVTPYFGYYDQGAGPGGSNMVPLQSAGSALTLSPGESKVFTASIGAFDCSGVFPNNQLILGATVTGSRTTDSIITANLPSFFTMNWYGSTHP